MRKLQWGMIGGGEGSQIGPAHRLGAGRSVGFCFSLNLLYLCAAWRRAIKNKSTQKRAGVSWWSCPGARMTEGTRKIASKNPQEVDERENPSLLNRP